MRSSMMRLLMSHSVSPVPTSLRPTAAAISPARTSFNSSREFACICNTRPIRSFLSRTELYTASPAFKNPGIHPEEGQVTDEGVGSNLERQRRKRLIVISWHAFTFMLTLF